MKNIYIYSAIIVVILGGIIFWQSNKSNNIGRVTDMPVLLSPSPVSTSQPTPTKNVVKPTPGVIIKEVTGYRYWVNLLEPLNAHLVLDENCTSIVPSQVTYPNNTQIMLDNTFSPQAHVLKIGSKEYSLDANGWLLITLSSAKLPAQLTMFCGAMELGQLDLE